jgi:hypothetical protein
MYPPRKRNIHRIRQNLDYFNGSETETSTIYWAQLSRFRLKTKTDRIKSPKRHALNKRQDDRLRPEL